MIERLDTDETGYNALRTLSRSLQDAAYTKLEYCSQCVDYVI